MLGGEVEAAEEIRQAADEAAIFVSLLSDPLENLLDEAAMMSPQAWADRFDTLYKGRGVIIDATITVRRTRRDRTVMSSIILVRTRTGCSGTAVCPDRPDRIRGDHPGWPQGR